MTPEQEERVVVALEAIATALQGPPRQIPSSGLPKRPGKMDSVANEVVGDLADVALDVLKNNPNANSREIWQAVRNSAKNQ